MSRAQLKKKLIIALEKQFLNVAVADIRNF